MTKANKSNRPIFLDGESLTLEDLKKVAVDRCEIQLLPVAIEKIRASRKVVEDNIASKRIIYGVTTGYGKLSNQMIDPSELEQLQINLVESTAAGVGIPLCEEEVRAMMLLRANVLAKGNSGVNIEIIETLIKMMNKGVHPIIPEKGSVGASGDLAPLAHLALVVIGEGEATFNGRRMPGEEAMRAAEIRPAKLKAKDGLSLVNGTQGMTGIGSVVLLRGEQLVSTAIVAGALTLEALRGISSAFHSSIHNSRPHPGQIATAKNLLELIEGSGLIDSDPKKVQDAYSLRCMPQVHGAVKSTLDHVRKVLEIELNSATDNPLVFPYAEDANDTILSGGNFHGEPIAMVMDFLGIALAELANISERRIERLVNPDLSGGLPAFLVARPGINSGFMIQQVTAAALVSENKILAHPASVDSIPTSANQEDHVSMGMHAAVKAREILKNAETVLAIELIAACQAIDFLDPSKLGKGTKRAYKLIRSIVSNWEIDRQATSDIERVTGLIREGQIADILGKDWLNG